MHRSTATAPIQPIAQGVIDSQPPVVVQSGCFPVAGEASAMTSGDSFPQLGNPEMAGRGSECRDWAVIAASSPLALHNRFAAFANGDHSNRNNNQNEEQFIEQKRRPKRSRQLTEQPVQPRLQQQRQQKQQEQQVLGGQRQRRSRVMMTGKSKSPGHAFILQR